MTHTCPECGHRMVEHPLSNPQLAELRYMRDHGTPLYPYILKRIEAGDKTARQDCRDLLYMVDKGYVEVVSGEGYTPSQRGLTLLHSLKL